MSYLQYVVSAYLPRYLHCNLRTMPTGQQLLYCGSNMREGCSVYYSSIKNSDRTRHGSPIGNACKTIQPCHPNNYASPCCRSPKHPPEDSAVIGVLLGVDSGVFSVSRTELYDKRAVGCTIVQSSHRMQGAFVSTIALLMWPQRKRVEVSPTMPRCRTARSHK